MTTIDLAMIDGVIHRARRQQLWQISLLAMFLAFTLASLAFGTYLLVTGKTAAGESLPPFALSLLAGFILVRSGQAIHRERAAYEGLAATSREALREAIQATAARIEGYRWGGKLVAFGMLPVFSLALAQLWSGGKMEGAAVASLALLIGVSAASVLVVFRHRITHQLRPRLEVLREREDALQ